jgi:hypothetical protein
MLLAGVGARSLVCHSFGRFQAGGMRQQPPYKTKQAESLYYLYELHYTLTLFCIIDVAMLPTSFGRGSSFEDDNDNDNENVQ